MDESANTAALLWGAWVLLSATFALAFYKQASTRLGSAVLLSIAALGLTLGFTASLGLRAAAVFGAFAGAGAVLTWLRLLPFRRRRSEIRTSAGVEQAEVLKVGPHWPQTEFGYLGGLPELSPQSVELRVGEGTLSLVPVTTHDSPHTLQLLEIASMEPIVVGQEEVEVGSPNEQGAKKFRSIYGLCVHVGDSSAEPQATVDSFTIRVGSISDAHALRGKILSRRRTARQALQGSVRRPPGPPVRNADELFGLVVASLDQFACELQGPQLPAVGLWDGNGGFWSPKSEGRLADEIALALRRDLTNRGGVTVREPEQRPSTGRGTGLRNDVVVSASVPPGSEGLRTNAIVIIEVKPQWADDLLTALPEQLVGKYLANDPGARHGVYFVGFYWCPRWDDPATRAKKAEARRYGGNSIDRLRLRLDEQAEALTAASPARTVRAVVADVRLPGEPQHQQ